MDFIRKHRSHISGVQRCIRWWERKRWTRELKLIKESRIFEGGDPYQNVDGKSKIHVC